MKAPSDIILVDNPPSFSDVEMDSAVISDKKTYKKTIKKLKRRLLVVQQAYYHQNTRVVVVFEGWDASGKGGAIRQLTEKLDPRGFQVHPIAAPEADEQGRHYLYRFQNRLPKPGRIAIFDRSYYGRVLVERVEGFASDWQWQRAYQELNEFERQLTDDGVRVIKIFLHITKEEQGRRFIERLENPLKRWKLTSEDIRNRQKWSEYEVAASDMFRLTSTITAPWHLIAANHKWYARIQVLKTVIKALEKGIDLTSPELDPQLIEEAMKEFGMDD
jgi:PPK2 family polyphosphate:nucleotide phosphotransferase